MFLTFITCLVVLFVLSYFLGRNRSVQIVDGATAKLHSRPSYHGGYLALWVVLPSLALLVLWSILAPMVIDGQVLASAGEATTTLTAPQKEAFLRDAAHIANGEPVGIVDDARKAAAAKYASYMQISTIGLAIGIVLLAAAGFWHAWRNITPARRTRHFVERSVMVLLIVCSIVAIMTTVGIVFSLIFESIRFFNLVPLHDFLFGLHWSPQSAFEGAGDAGTKENLGLVFGAIPLFAGTMLITLIAMLIAAPIGLLAAIYLSDYATARFRAYAKPVLEILAGIPTVVYGFFAALTVAPMFRGFGESLGLSVSSESALAAGLVMGIMIIPFVSSLSDDVINAVPQSLRDGSAGLGATRSETILRVVLPAALPGIVSALLLAISRAIGETMIVVMAAGLAANLTINPLEAVTTVTVQIVTLLVGDQEFDSAKTLAAFALGLVLFCITLLLNIIALRVVQKYREQYD